MGSGDGLTVTVYSKPGCGPCRATYDALERFGVPYTVVDLATTPAAVEYVTEDLGYMAAPVVVVDEHDHWSGFRPDLIARLANRATLLSQQ